MNMMAHVDLPHDNMAASTQVLITVDTELSAALHQQGVSPGRNYESSILGRCNSGDFGIVHQMKALEKRGLRAVFFVDPLPALVYGPQIIADIVGPILERGHDVQLHLHTEWLKWAMHSPVGDRTGRNLADFNAEDQVTLLRCACDLLMDAGAPKPIAFRAGNFGANEDSLRALKQIGIIWDSSFNPAYVDMGCDIALPPEQIAPAQRRGITVLPVAALHDRADNIRPAQVCALSSAEMSAAIQHATQYAHPTFVIVTHSFELLSRDRKRANRSVVRRFAKMADDIAAHPDLDTAIFPDLCPTQFAIANGDLSRLEPDALRTGNRIVEQLLATLLYERKILPG